jgi:hypothetical protein
MPYRSESQRRFFHSTGAKKAGISSGTVNEFDKTSKNMKLPEHVPNPKRKSNFGRTRKILGGIK